MKRDDGDMGEDAGHVSGVSDTRVVIYAINADTVRRTDQAPLRAAMPKRMAKAQRFRFEKDRLLCIGAGILMREIVGIRDESELREDSFGKLSAPGYPEFNLSHSGEWCVLAMARDEIGIDIERTDPAHLSVAPRVFTDAELSWMNESPAERFCQLWTWKESAIKAVGAGLSIDMRSFEALPFIHGGPICLEGRSLYAGTYAPSGYRCSVCVSHPVTCVEWVEL